jgi:hypothetical protein
LRNKDFFAGRSVRCGIATQRSGLVLQGFFPAPVESKASDHEIFTISNQYLIGYISCEYYSTVGLTGPKDAAPRSGGAAE